MLYNNIFIKNIVKWFQKKEIKKLNIKIMKINMKVIEKIIKEINKYNTKYLKVIALLNFNFL